MIGVDNSAAMVAAARERERPGRLEFRQADLTEWQPDETFDVVLLNAVLQWIPNHTAQLPRLAALLAPGGVLGIQMPGSWPSETSSTDMIGIAREMTREPQWRDKLGDVYVGDENLLDPEDYLAALGDLGLRAEAWRTLYANPRREAMPESAAWRSTRQARYPCRSRGPHARRERAVPRRVLPAHRRGLPAASDRRRERRGAQPVPCLHDRTGRTRLASRSWTRRRASTGQPIALSRRCWPARQLGS